MVTFPTEFNAKCHFKNVEDDKIYHLYGVIYHMGENARTGHYAARCWSIADDNWYLFDDSIVTPVDNIPYEDASIVFYSMSDREEHKRAVREHERKDDDSDS